MSDRALRFAAVTGGDSGIGRAVAQALARSGWLIAVMDRHRPTEGAFADRVIDYQVDVTSEEEVNGALADFAARGQGCLDLLVNSAGLLATGDFESLPLSTYANLLNVNNFGVAVCCAKAYPYLLTSAQRGRRPCVVNLASASALAGIPSMAIYSASKFWVTGFTEALAAEWRDRGIAVRDVLPPFVDTPMLRGRDDNRLLARLGATLTAEQTAGEVLRAARGGPPHRLVTVKLQAAAFLIRFVPRAVVIRLLGAAAGH